MFKSGKSVVRWSMVVALVLALGVGAVSALNIPGFGKYEKVKAINGAVVLPAAKVGDGKAHFYKYSEGGKETGFFVVKGEDGSIRTAFDACDVCFKEKKGYDQQGEYMVCKNCNKKFAISQIGPHATGGCNPSYLPHRQAGGNIVISVEDLKSGARFF